MPYSCICTNSELVVLHCATRLAMTLPSLISVMPLMGNVQKIF